jgi:hypothetical protein
MYVHRRRMFHDEGITVGRTPGYGDEGNADVFRVLIEEGKVVREVNLTRSEKWESNPNEKEQGRC